MSTAAPKDAPEKHAKLRTAAAVVFFGGLAVFGARACVDALSSPETSEDDPAAASAEASASAAPAAPPRCASLGRDVGFTIGEVPAAKAPIVVDAGEQAPFDDLPDEPDLAPFAVEVGRGATFEGGFAVGALRDAEGGSVASVVTLGPDGQNGKIVRLARSRGDMDAPVVTGYRGAVLAGMAEPNASGRSLKIAKVTGDIVGWGIELSEGRDESLAFDLAAGARTGVVTWDDVSPDGKRSVVMLATFDPETMRLIASARPISEPKLDAESPRIVARAGGFWLAYVVHEEAEPTRRDRGKTRRDDEEEQGEVIVTTSIHVMPLDESGTPVSTQKRVTPKGGHVLAFDLEAVPGGGALVAYRDDDTPTGSSGGVVASVFFDLGSVSEPRVLAEEGVGAGIPDLLPGWIAIADVRGPKRLAAITVSGEIVDGLEPEPAIGAGELIAASQGSMLVAYPQGKAVRLGLVRCTPRAAVADGGAAP